jgi:CRP-like cAMP-binding protein
MLYKTQRTSSVRALEECELWVIDRQLFKEAVE